MRYDVLLCDADNTLFDFNKAEENAFAMACETMGFSSTPELLATYSKINEALWKLLEQGGITQDVLRVRRFEQFLEAIHREDDAQKMCDAFVDALGRQSVPLDGAVEAVKRWSAKVPVVIVTNGIGQVQRGRMAGSEIRPYISGLVISEEVGAAKPNPLMLENGWTFDDSFPGASGDTLYQHEFLYQLYLHADPHYSGRVTVPVLWDKKNHTIVSNESAEIIRMFNTAFDALGAKAGDYYPPALQPKIDELNGWIYDTINNGVYKAGFATSQQAYDEAVAKVFESLARLEQILGQHRYLTGNQLTEADIRLWTTLVRFDPVYVTHFKCDKHRISDYLNLYGFLRDIYQMPGIAETVNFDHIRNHYFRSHKTINPTGIISIGPWQDLDEPHGRDVRFG